MKKLAILAAALVLPTAANPQGSWLRPTSVLQPRFVKFSVQVDF